MMVKARTEIAKNAGIIPSNRLTMNDSTMASTFGSPGPCRSGQDRSGLEIPLLRAFRSGIGIDGAGRRAVGHVAERVGDNGIGRRGRGYADGVELVCGNRHDFAHAA